uniref:Uncharacterized protein n=1 Tax=Lactuca sativa TaxID=4236 RepID=A0A9R1W6D7_LACSA|nr:hypothetical protein LSAT_V11C300112820 [Lactuca sativa]
MVVWGSSVALQRDMKSRQKDEIDPPGNKRTREAEQNDLRLTHLCLIPNVPTMTSQAVDNGVVHQKEIVFANNIKGVVHTHSNILAQVKTLSTAWEYTSSDHFLHCLPLHHILK